MILNKIKLVNVEICHVYVCITDNSIQDVRASVSGVAIEGPNSSKTFAITAVILGLQLHLIPL